MKNDLGFDIYLAISGLLAMGVEIFLLAHTVVLSWRGSLYAFFFLVGCVMFFFGTKKIIWHLWKPKGG